MLSMIWDAYVSTSSNATNYKQRPNAHTSTFTLLWPLDFGVIGPVT